MSTKLLVTGGAGFIGSALVRHLIAATDYAVVNLDKLTYASSLDAVAAAAASPRYAFEQADLCDAPALLPLLRKHQVDGIVHLAAETHVDRSIDGPAAFVQSNVVGTFNLLEAAREYWNGLAPERRLRFRFHHVSTDEVFGSLGAQGAFTEDSPYAPNSPYSASKAAADHLARAWHHTYGLPVVMSNCSNNYGPFQFPEKLIPRMILNAVDGRPLPVYGNGENVRDWLHVEDHARALVAIFEKARTGERYNVGGHGERRNIDVVRTLCAILDELRPARAPHAELITYVEDRKGHDLRYAIDAFKIARDLAWKPQESFETGLRQTVQWYLEHLDWCRAVQQHGHYDGGRLGLGRAAG